MPEILSDELISKIRFYVKKYNSKIDAATKLGISYDTVLSYTRDIKLKLKKMDPEYSGIYGKTLDLLRELMNNGYAFSSGKYGLKEYIKLKKYFPQIRRTKMYGRMIYYLNDKSKEAAKALLNVSNRRTMSYQKLKRITKTFDMQIRKND